MTAYSTNFTVEGTGRFPFDMLRYDSCHPSTSEDAAKMAADYGEPPLGRRQVKLTHTDAERHWKPTAGRWNSFMWRVLPETRV